MQFGFTMAPGRGDTDLILEQVAQRMIAAGLCPAGTAQINTERPDAGPCDMDVLVLPSGPRICISQNLGAGARGCRLDPEALENAVSLVQARLPQSDCLIVNKFGRHEAEGHGFRPVIADAVAMGLPVMVGLNALNAPAFDEFSGGLAAEVAPDVTAISDWLLSNIAAHRTANRVA